MDNVPPGSSHNLRRGLFGYHPASVDQWIHRCHVDEATQIEQWSDTMTQMAINIARLEERTASTIEMANYWRQESERMKRQLDMEKAVVRYAEEGVQVEIRRLEEEYEQRARESKSVQSRHKIATKHYEEILWRLSESLTHVLQEAQSMASRVLTTATSDTVWQEIRTTLIGTDDDSLAPRPLIENLVWEYPLPPKRVQALSRSGENLGFVEAVIISSTPTRVLAYVISLRGAVHADQVQVIRNGSLIVGRSAPFVSTAEILAPFYTDMDEAPHLAPKTPDPQLTTIVSLATGTRDRARSDVRHNNQDSVDAPSDPNRSMMNGIPDCLSPAVVAVNNRLGTPRTHQIERPPEHSVPFLPDRTEGSGNMVPSWGYAHQLPPRQSDDSLRLPGLDSEDAPPVVPRAKPPLGAIAEQDPLPGVSAPRPSPFPSPSWTNEPEASKQPSVGADSTAPSATPVAAAPGPHGDGASLDVRSFLYGKRVGQDILDPQNIVIAQKDDLITPELVQRAESAGRLPDLIVHMAFE